MVSLSACLKKMEKASLPDYALRMFERSCRMILKGGSGHIPEKQIQPLEPGDIRESNTLAEYAKTGRKALAETVVIKLNGGLGTSMGLDRAKSLLPVRGELRFLDIVIRQLAALNVARGRGIPLVLMNSFRTQDDCAPAVKAYPEQDIRTFLQSRFPRLDARTLEPVSWPRRPDLEWAPPGHGEVYAALAASGMLDEMLNRGYRYGFISNIDNLGAVIDECILGLLAAGKMPFLMEVAHRTAADRKGGHLARHRDGRIILRESAQCADDERHFFEDIRRYRFFNTNSIWIDLRFLRNWIDNNNMAVDLPVIRNTKRVDPRDPASPRVVQLESAMGAMVGLLEAPGIVSVPRSRFRPVKTCDDLLILWSDCFEINEKWEVQTAPRGGTSLPDVRLDPAWFGRIDQLREHFVYGAPSLVGCSSLRVTGDVRFGKGVRIEGDAVIENHGVMQAQVDNNTVVGDHKPLIFPTGSR